MAILSKNFERIEDLTLIDEKQVKLAAYMVKVSISILKLNN